jgi:hypothetical protein
MLGRVEVPVPLALPTDAALADMTASGVLRTPVFNSCRCCCLIVKELHSLGHVFAQAHAPSKTSR